MSEVTAYAKPSDIPGPAAQGTYIHGLYLEVCTDNTLRGLVTLQSLCPHMCCHVTCHARPSHPFILSQGARWDSTRGCLRSSQPGVLHQPMPVLLVRAATTADAAQHAATAYQCPVYANSQRANVYSPMVATFTLDVQGTTTAAADDSVRTLLDNVALCLSQCANDCRP